MEDRQGKRVATRFEVGLLGDLVDGTGCLVDLSTTGCRLQSSEGMKPNGHIHLFLRPPHANVPVKVERAAIRWVNGQEVGLEFVRVHPEQQKRLHNLVDVLGVGPNVERIQPGTAPSEPRPTSAANDRDQRPSRWQDLLDKLYNRWG